MLSRMMKGLGQKSWLIALMMGLTLAVAAPAPLYAQEAAPAVEAAAAAAAVTTTTEAATEAAAEAAPEASVPAHLKGTIDTGSTAWLLVSSALVLLMLPGLALFYGGMVRAKNVLNTFLNVMVCCGIIGILWVVVGYALVFPVVDQADGKVAALLTMGKNEANGTTISLLGWDSNLAFMRYFTENYAAPITSGDTTGAVATGVPELAFAMFQGMFAIITPALIIGAVAERVKFLPLLIFLGVWSLIVYCPIAHMVWNVNGMLFQKGVLDFAGGTVVHVLAGVSALALTIVVGPRKGFGKTPMPPHSLGYTLIGAGLLWFGWFGFNAGSAIAIPGAELPVAGGVAALAFANTQIAAAAAGLAWMVVEWLKDGKPTILGFASGVVAGLVVITPCAGHVSPSSAIIIGGIGGGVCYFGCQLKKLFRYDDSLDAFGVHGIGGALGALLVGIFAIRPVLGGSGQFMTQLQGLLIAAVFAFIVSLILGYILKFTLGLRVSEQDEVEGLDIATHGESGYNLSTTN